MTSRTSFDAGGHGGELDELAARTAGRWPAPASSCRCRAVPRGSRRRRRGSPACRWRAARAASRGRAGAADRRPRRGWWGASGPRAGRSPARARRDHPSWARHARTIRCHAAIVGRATDTALLPVTARPATLVAHCDERADQHRGTEEPGARRPRGARAAPPLPGTAGPPRAAATPPRAGQPDRRRCPRRSSRPSPPGRSSPSPDRGGRTPPAAERLRVRRRPRRRPVPRPANTGDVPSKSIAKGAHLDRHARPSTRTSTSASSSTARRRRRPRASRSRPDPRAVLQGHDAATGSPTATAEVPAVRLGERRRHRRRRLRVRPARERAGATASTQKGTIAIARSDSPYSQSTQFFIVYGDTTLDGSTGGYTVVGKVTSGLSELESKIAAKGIASPGSDGTGAPKVATTITGATIAEQK